MPSETLQSHNFVNFWMYIHVFKSLTSKHGHDGRRVLAIWLAANNNKKQKLLFFLEFEASGSLMKHAHGSNETGSEQVKGC